MKYSDAVSKELTGRRSQKFTNRAAFRVAKKMSEKGTWKEVSAKIGISESTLRRARAGLPLSNDTKRKIEALKNSRDVRENAMKPSAIKNLNNACQNGAKFKMTAKQGPYGSGGSDNRRRRTIEFDLPPEVWAAMRDAYLDGDDERAAAILSDGIADYGWAPEWTPPGGWDVGNVENLSITGR